MSTPNLPAKAPRPRGRPRKDAPPIPDEDKPIPLSRHVRAFRRLKKAVKQRHLENAMWAIVELSCQELEETGHMGLTGRDVVKLMADLGRLSGDIKPPDEDSLLDWLGPDAKPE